MKKFAILFSILALTFCSGGNNTAIDEHDHSDATHTHEGETTASAHQEVDDGGHTHEGETTQPAQAEEDAGHEHQHLDVTPAKQRAWGVRVGQVEPQKLSSQIVLPGVISLNENKTAYVTSFVHGQIAKLSVDLGSKVRKGQTIVVINSPDFAQIQADFLQTRASYNLSRIEYERAQALWKNNAIGEKDLLRRQAEHDKLSSEYGALGLPASFAGNKSRTDRGAYPKMRPGGRRRIQMRCGQPQPVSPCASFRNRYLSGRDPGATYRTGKNLVYSFRSHNPLGRPGCL